MRESDEEKGRQNKVVEVMRTGEKRRDEKGDGTRTGIEGIGGMKEALSKDNTSPFGRQLKRFFTFPRPVPCPGSEPRSGRAEAAPGAEVRVIG